MYRSKPKGWTQNSLELCTGDELKALCLLMGVPHSGPKAVTITRLLDTAALRVELSTWGEYRNDDYLKSHEKVHEIATDICARYKRADLVALAKKAKTFYSLPKRGIVIALLQWRDRCRVKGQKFNNEIKRARRIQYILPGFA
jgi:hypothetical protein